MSLNLRFPNITGFTEREQLAQIKSFLHQLVNDLNFAQLGDGSGQSTEYEYQLRSMIMQEFQQQNAEFAALKKQLYPDMILDEEYATGEKYNGKAVYTKALLFGSMPNNTSSSVSLGTGLSVISIDGYCVNGSSITPLAFHEAISTILYNSSNGNLYIETNGDASGWTAYLTVKYTKV